MPLPRCAEMVRQAIECLSGAAQAAEEEAPSGAEATALALEFARAEKIAAAATVRLARRTKDPGGVLSGAQGTGAGAARRKLEAAEAASAVPVLQGALEAGDVSWDQAGVLAPVAAVSTEDAARLVEEAAHGASLPELKKKAERRLRAFRDEHDEVARERALHARRYCRVSEVDGGIRLDALLSGVDAARVAAALQTRTDAALRASWADGTHEPVERLRADALVALVVGEALGAQVVLRVDAAALVRGALADDEVCEVEGIGEVSLATARSLLPESVLTTVIRDGSDIRTVSSATRVIPRKVRRALYERDRGACVVPGCGRTRYLQIDHWQVEFSAHGLTEEANLCLVCSRHHRMKHRTGFRLTGGPAKWEWLAPLRR